MSGDVQKIPLAIGLTRLIEDKGEAETQMLGKSLPASIVDIDDTGTIVLVKFEVESDFFTLPQVECALATSKYNRPPLQKGDMGFVVACDYYMGGVTGLGGGIANFEKQPNLTTLVFIPVGNTNFTALDDGSSGGGGGEGSKTNGTYFVMGPEGVILETTDEETSLTLQKDAGVMISAPLGHNVLGANLVLATDDGDARAKGIPTFGFYYVADGTVHMVRP